jgi:hypothetical protein
MSQITLTIDIDTKAFKQFVKTVESENLTPEEAIKIFILSYIGLIYEYEKASE